MLILYAQPCRVTLSNLVKVPHVFSHHANSKPLAQQCDHTLQTTTNRQINLTFDGTIRLLLNQDKTITMIADLQHNKLALSNKNMAQDHPSDPFYPTIQTRDILQTTKIQQDEILVLPTQQILYSATVKD